MKIFVLATLAVAARAAAYCSLPSTYNWTSTEPLAQPANGWSALQEFTHVTYKGKNLVYGTTRGKQATWGSMTFGLFSDWSQMGSAKQTALSGLAISPSLFFFRPKNIWILAHQWGPTPLSFRTSKDPSDAASWSSPQPLFTGKISNSVGPVDQAIIADEKDIYLFFCGNNGKIYSASMPIDKFPSNFGNESSIIMSESTLLLFEGIQVYSIAGKQGYLMLVQALGSKGRYFRSFTAPSLKGPWTPQAATEASPFAGKANTEVTWTSNIGHGELIRKNPDQTMTIDPCHLELLYQGYFPEFEEYALIPYRPAVLTLKQ